MQISRQQFAKDVLHIIHEICKLVYNQKSDEDVDRIFGVNAEQLESIINKIVNGLPDGLFDGLTQRKFRELEQIFSREFIFFQVQEKVDDPRYQLDLANFITIFSKDILDKLQAWKNEKASGNR